MSRIAVPPVLIVQHAAPETTGALGDALARGGLAHRTIRTYEGDPVPRRLGEARALVVMGGPMGVYEQERYPHLADELALIDDALRREAPVLGVCLGSQLLAAALGARVYPGPAKELGWFPLEWLPEAHDDPLFAGVAAQSLTAFHWHGDRFDPPRGARVLARSALTPVQVFEYQAHAYGLLCHFEVTRALLAAMLSAFADEARAAGHDPNRILAEGPARVPALSVVAGQVFDRWVTLVTESIPHPTRAS